MLTFFYCVIRQSTDVNTASLSHIDFNRDSPGIDAILAADFLSVDQKADILCRNAARFLRLDAAICT